jgi:cysteine desulfurase
VLRALGLSDPLIESSLRLSLGRFTTLAEIDQAVLSFRRGVEYLQALAPAEVAV